MQVLPKALEFEPGNTAALNAFRMNLTRMKELEAAVATFGKLSASRRPIPKHT